MRPDAPSITAAGVAIARARLDRPAAATGDPDAENRLAALLIARVRDHPDAQRRRRQFGDFANFVAVRTRFFDEAVTDAIRDGITQIVILGAGYDARALRFRTPGVRFFEVDHPATQATKRELLAAIDAETDDITFVAGDFTEPGLAGTIKNAGYDPKARSLFVCEGVLRYLPEQWFRELLRVAAELAAPETTLAVSISTRDPGDQPHDERLGTDEPVLTVPTRAVALKWLAAAGWEVTEVRDVAELAEESVRRGRLLVRARPA